MGIDKIKKKKKKTKKYKKRMPFWGGGESYGGDPSAGADDGGPGSGPSGPSGDDGPSGPDNSEPGVSPTPTVSFSDNSEPGISPTPTVDFSDTNEPGVSPVATTAYNYEGPTYDEEVGINTPPSTPVDFSDTNEPGINPYPTTPVDFTDNSEPGINPGLYNPPTYVDNSNNISGIKNIKQFAPIKDPKGGFKKGITGLLKLLASTLIPGLLPAQLGKAYQTYKTGKGIYNAAKFVGNKFDKTKGITKTFDDRLKSALTKGPGGTKPPTGFNNDDNNEGNTLVAKNVIAAGREQYSPERINALKKDIDLFGDVIQNRTYTIKGNTINLNNSQIAQVANKRSELMKEYDMIKDYQVT